MSLYVPLPGALKFEKFVLANRKLSKGLKQKTLSTWEVKMDKEELREFLIENKVNFKIK